MTQEENRLQEARKGMSSHQTGWTGLVAKTIQLFGLLDGKRSLEAGKRVGFVKGAEAPHEVKVAVA